MTRDEAYRLLNLPPNAGRANLDAHYAEARKTYARKLQYATDPKDRDAASKALALLQQAYRILTGSSPLQPIAPATGKKKTGGRRPAKQRTQVHTASKTTRRAPRWHGWPFSVFWGPWQATCTRESLIGAGICAFLTLMGAAFLIGMLVGASRVPATQPTPQERTRIGSAEAFRGELMGGQDFSRNV